MKKIIGLLAVASLACGLQYDGFRVKFGWSDALANEEYFFKIPRTLGEAEAEGWHRLERPPGPLPELRLHCPPGRIVCVLYDTAGFVAGLQIALPVEEFEPQGLRPEKRFVKWRAPPMEGEPSRDYWTATQFLVSEESLKAGAGPQIENGATLQDGGVWVTGLDGRLMRIPSTEAELNSTIFKKQNCIPNMGTHYHHNMTREMNCDDLFPWFALVTQGDLVGTGFQTFGKLSKQQPRDWFEPVVSPRMSAEITIPFAPDCLLDMASNYSIVSLHMYYIDKPWTIICRPGDSAKPAPPLERLMVNGYRYASKVADEIKKIFSG